MRLSKFAAMLLTALVVAAWAAPSLAAGAGDLKAMKAKVEEAAKFLGEKGEPGLAEISDPKGKWAAEPYIFAYNLEGTIIAHSNPPTLVGKNLLSIKDVKGFLFAAEFVKIAKSPGKGWSEYWWPKPGEKQASQKVSYIMKVPGKDWLVGAGIYDFGKAQAIKEAGE